MTNEDLCKAIQDGTGDRKDLIAQLYTQNAGMIERIIKRYAGLEDPEDLRREAFFGISRAADLWTPDRDSSFINYAVYWIRQAVQRYIEDCGGVVRVPSYRRAQIYAYNRTLNNYRLRFGRDPSQEELCAALDMGPAYIEDLKRDALALQIRSTSEPIGEDGATAEDFLKDQSDPIGDLLDRIQGEQLAAAIREQIDGLQPRAATVLHEHFLNGRTLGECGELLGVSAERARQLEQEGLRTLRRSKSARILRPYFTESGARSAGLKGVGVSAYRKHGSAQERAVIHLEAQTRKRLYDGEQIKEG